MTDRPTTPNENCTHPVATHYHGTYAAYTLDACRCDDCRTARRRYDRHRAKWAGEFPTVAAPRVDAEPVRRHLESLMEQGMGPKRIAAVSGVPHGAISKLLYGNYKGRPPSKTINRKNAETLTALQLDVADGAKVDGTEAHRIVDELLARGWWKAEIGRRVHGPNALSLQLNDGAVFAGKLRILRTLLDEDVPLRLHTPTGRMLDPSTDHEWRMIPATTPGVPDEFKPGSPVWLAVMRAGLKQAVEDSIGRHGRVA